MEAQELLRKSKICLNSTKTILNGSHERPLISAACGSIVLTNKTSFFYNLFQDSSIFYNDTCIDESIENVEEVLNNDTKRIKMAKTSYEQVMANHTWKNRAEQIIDMLK